MNYNYNEILEPWYPEEFKIITMPPIKKDMYAISNYGTVINIKTNRKLCIFQGGGGYSNVALQNMDNSRKIYYIHILVAYHFIPKTQDDIINNRIYVNHKNFCRSMNYVHNLEWVNDSENNKHSYVYREYPRMQNDVVVRLRDETWGTMRTTGSKNGMARLTEEQVENMCKLAELGGYTRIEICKLSGLEATNNDINIFNSIIKGKRWKHVSCKYNLPDLINIPIR